MNLLRSSVFFAQIAFVGSMATTDLATDLAKNYVGRMRPFFYEKCDFNEESASCQLPLAQLDLLRQSFPSGHASLGTCAMLFTTLYLLGKIGHPACPDDLWCRCLGVCRHCAWHLLLPCWPLCPCGCRGGLYAAGCTTTGTILLT